MLKCNVQVSRYLQFDNTQFRAIPGGIRFGVATNFERRFSRTGDRQAIPIGGLRPPQRPARRPASAIQFGRGAAGMSPELSSTVLLGCRQSLRRSGRCLCHHSQHRRWSFAGQMVFGADTSRWSPSTRRCSPPLLLLASQVMIQMLY